MASRELVVESPDVIDDDRLKVIGREALDILASEELCVRLPSKMTVGGGRTRVGVEVKADGRLLDKLLLGMQACKGNPGLIGTPITKMRGIAGISASILSWRRSACAAYGRVRLAQFRTVAREADSSSVWAAPMCFGTRLR